MGPVSVPGPLESELELLSVEELVADVVLGSKVSGGPSQNFCWGSTLATHDWPRPQSSSCSHGSWAASAPEKHPLAKIKHAVGAASRPPISRQA
jgi:hypothetical protein